MNRSGPGRPPRAGRSPSSLRPGGGAGARVRPARHLQREEARPVEGQQRRARPRPGRARRLRERERLAPESPSSTSAPATSHSASWQPARSLRGVVVHRVRLHHVASGQGDPLPGLHLPVHLDGARLARHVGDEVLEAARRLARRGPERLGRVDPRHLGELRRGGAVAGRPGAARGEGHDPPDRLEQRPARRPRRDRERPRALEPRLEQEPVPQRDGRDAGAGGGERARAFAPRPLRGRRSARGSALRPRRGAACGARASPCSAATRGRPGRGARATRPRRDRRGAAPARSRPRRAPRPRAGPARGARPRAARGAAAGARAAPRAAPRPARREGPGAR